MNNHKGCMKTKMAIGFITGLLFLGMVQLAVSQTAFESARKNALDLYASLISLATPQVRVKISGAALAFKNYLAQCSPNCDVYQFCFKDLKARFIGLTDNEIYLLMALVFGEAVSSIAPPIQELLQTETRLFTVVSNVMKVKHDTLKNSISNIR